MRTSSRMQTPSHRFSPPQFAAVAALAVGGVLASICLFAHPSAWAQKADNVFTGHVVAVTAGDTMDVRVGDDWTVTVRLHGVECPTAPRALRETATRYTSRLLLDTDVRVEVRGTASRSVVYGEVFPGTGGESVNFILARDGLATWASQYAAGRADLEDAEAYARTAQRGLWGANDGTNVSLPASVADAARRRAVKNTAAEAARARAAAIKAGASSSAVRSHPPSPAPATPAPATPPPPSPATPRLVSKPKVAAATVRVTSVSAPHAKPVPPPVLTTDTPALAPLVGGISVAVLSLLSFLAYGVARGLSIAPKRLFAQSLLALLAGGLGAMAFALPVADWRAAFAGGGTSALTAVATLIGPLAAVMFLRAGIGVTRTAARLRGAAADPRRAGPGPVKLQGTARSATGELMRASVGRIKGLYVREVTSRYTAETGTGKRLGAPRWVEVRDTAGAVDFEILSSSGDGTGSALILAAQDDETPQSLAKARWVPYHVARFYNEVPTDTWFATAYEGDIRTEVFFVPDGSTLTVWGDLHPPDPTIPDKTLLPPVPRVAPGGAAGALLLCDGPEARAYAGRGTASLPVGIGAVVIGIACVVGALWGIGAGSELARQSAVAGLGAGLAAALFLTVWRGALLARNRDREEREGETDPLRRPATVAWERYKRGLPGIVIAPAVGE